jgi:5-methylcytosine-specific restriction endonuclease McrA
MKLCGGCQTTLPNDWKGLCTACKADRYKPSSDNIKSHTAVSFNGTYDAKLDALRKDRRWREQVQPRIVKRDPMCKRCGVAVTAIIDHVVPAAEAIRQVRESGRFPCSPNAGYYLESNLQGLCAKCHSAKTQEDRDHAGAWPSVLEEYDRQPKKIWSF